MDEKNRVERFKTWCQTHPVISILIIVGTILTVLIKGADLADKFWTLRNKYFASRKAPSQSAYFDEILKLFEKEVGYPPPSTTPGFSPVEYAKRVDSFAEKHGLDATQRELLRQRIKDVIDSQERGLPTSGSNETLSGEPRLSRSSGTSGLPQIPFPGYTEATPPPDRPSPAPGVPGRTGARQNHGAGVFLKLNSTVGTAHGKAGDLATALTSVRSLDSYGDTLLLTNLVLVFYHSSGAVTSANLLASSVVFRQYESSVTVSNNFKLLPEDRPQLLINAVGGGRDLYNAPGQTDFPRNFQITFPGQISIE